MSVRRQIPEMSGTYFITFTCFRWLKLFEITHAYDKIYQCFDEIKKSGHDINAYVIMPNHLHMFITFHQSTKAINSIIGEFKRFLAYYIINTLKNNQQIELLQKLATQVNQSQRKLGKKHEVFEPSFDWKECRTQSYLNQKLDYIHYNPCKCDPPLVVHPCKYEFSSAKEYICGENGIYSIMNIHY